MRKFLVIGLVLVFALALGADCVSPDGLTLRCPECVKTGKRSTVEVGTCMTTAMFCGNGYYDADGNFHPPPPCNTTTCSASCSEGHEFCVSWGGGRL